MTPKVRRAKGGWLPVKTLHLGPAFPKSTLLWLLCDCSVLGGPGAQDYARGMGLVSQALHIQGLGSLGLAQSILLII